MEDQIPLLQNFYDILPGKIFIYTEQKTYSYKESADRIDRYTSFLIHSNITSGYAAVVSGNNPETIFLIMALWQAGVVPVMINTRLTGKEMSDIITSVPCRTLFFHKNIHDLPSFDIPAMVFPFASKVHRKKYVEKITQNDPAVIIFTSGSTSKPRAVELSFKTLSDASEIQNKFLCHSTGDKWLASLPFYHIGGFSIIIRSLLLKSSIVFPLSLGSKDLCSTILKFKPEYISVVGTQLKEMLDTGFAPPGNIKHILVGGGFTSAALIKRAIDNGWRISRVYGSTETAAFVAAVGHKDLQKFPDATGKEILPGSLFVLDNNKKRLIDAEGEIALKNIPLMNGYLNDAAGTDKKYHSEFYMTGDFGLTNKEGYLFVIMRRGDMIVSGGENINLLEIEGIIREIDGVEDIVLIPVQDEKWGQLAAAVICSRKNLTEYDIKDYLSTRISKIKIPKQYFFIDKIPRSEIGKVQMDSLKRTLNIL